MNPRPRSRAADPLLTGLYAWGVSVALPLAHRTTPVAAWITCGTAVAAVVAGALTLQRWPTLGRALGIGVFVAACAASWALARTFLVGARFDPWLGALGSLGWALYAATWGGSHAAGAPLRPGRVGEVKGEPEVKADPEVEGAPKVLAQPELLTGPEVEGLPQVQLDAEGEPGAEVLPLQPRSRIPAWPLVLAAAGCAGAAVLVALPWWIPDRERAFVGHGAALAGAVAVLSVALKLAVEVSTPSPAQAAFGRAPRSVRRALWHARWPLGTALAVALLGAILLAKQLR